MKTHAVNVYITVSKTYLVEADSSMSAKSSVESKVDYLLTQCGGDLSPLQKEGFEVCDDDMKVEYAGYREEE